MGIPTVAGVAGMASGLADRAVETYRTRLEAQVQRRRIDSLKLSMLVNASLAAVGMVVDVVGLQVRVNALQQALDEAVAAGDLETAEVLRGQQVAMLKEPRPQPGSWRPWRSTSRPCWPSRTAATAG